MKWPALTIRTRLQLWHGLLLACVLAAFGITAYRLHWADEVRRIDRELNEPLAQMHRALAGGGRDGARGGVLRHPGPPGSFTLPPEIAGPLVARGYYYAMWTREGRLLTQAAEAPASLAMPSRSGNNAIVTHWRTVGSMREAFIFTPPGECLLVGVPLRGEFAALARLGWWLLALGVGVLAIGLLVDAWILRRSIQPVERIIGAAERISQGRLSARIATNGAGGELQRLTSVLNRTFASLESAFSQQARFSADVAHELRTPVSVLITESQLALERERDGSDYRETIATSLRSAQRMGALIESLLDLSQIQSSQPATHGPCDLSVLAAEAVASLRSMAAQHGVTLEAALDPAPCTGDAAQLAQIVSNLLINAIQHNHRGGEARIATAVEAGRAVLRVQNTGAAIPAEHLPHVFERFYRADPSRSRKTGGVGLGLAIGKAIADAHGAQLEVASAAGTRTTFALTMPAAMRGE